MKAEDLLEYKEPVNVLYVCDRTQCDNCHDYCSHTVDIRHAVNFKQANHNAQLFSEIPKLTPNEYQQAALRTASNTRDTYKMLQEGLMGLNGEAGECIDILKKYLFQGHGLDRDHLAEELGDVAWYLAVTAHAIGWSFEDILKKNIEKLNKRYPDGFDAERSVNR
jgi:NTP pyrophosphatase (non-canonical NTP hydrolase)